MKCLGFFYSYKTPDIFLLLNLILLNLAYLTSNFKKKKIWCFNFICQNQGGFTF